MRHALLLLLWALSGCTTLRCVPATVVVAEVQRQERLESRVESQSIDPVTGRLQEVHRDIVVPTYWVRAAEGDWIAVDEAAWRRAEKGSRSRSVARARAPCSTRRGTRPS